MIFIVLCHEAEAEAPNLDLVGSFFKNDIEWYVHHYTSKIMIQIRNQKWGILYLKLQQNCHKKDQLTILFETYDYRVVNSISITEIRIHFVHRV